LAFLPRRRTRHHRGRVRSFPRDNAKAPIHLTAFMGYKAGMTHVTRHHEKREGKKIIKKDIVEPVSIIECPPMKIVGLVGYIDTPRGIRQLATVFAQHLGDDLKRRFYKNWSTAKKKAFSKYVLRWTEDSKSKKSIQRDIERIKKYCSIVRVLA
jgi:large subunit ribosomal protein L3e